MVGNRVRLAREVTGLTQTELAERIGTTQSGVASIEANLYRPSAEYLGTIAKETGFGLAFFEPPIVEEFPSGALLYRAKAALTKAERQQAHGLTSIAFELAVHLGRELNRVPVNLPRLKETPQKAAQITRAAFGVAPDVPITDLIQRAEKNGVLVLAIPTETSSLDGFATWVSSPYPRPIVALLGGKVGYRTNFTLGEEIGHAVLHTPLTVPVAMADKQAREFAQELLLPKEAMLQELSRPVTLSSLASLKPRWRVSLQMLAVRAHSLNLITPNQYRYLFQQIKSNGWHRLEPGDESVPQLKPRLMRKMAELQYGNPINLDKLSMRTGIPAYLLADLLGVELPKKSARILAFKSKD